MHARPEASKLQAAKKCSRPKTHSEIRLTGFHLETHTERTQTVTSVLPFRALGCQLAKCHCKARLSSISENNSPLLLSKRLLPSASSHDSSISNSTLARGNWARRTASRTRQLDSSHNNCFSLSFPIQKTRSSLLLIRVPHAASPVTITSSSMYAFGHRTRSTRCLKMCSCLQRLYEWVLQNTESKKGDVRNQSRLGISSSCRSRVLKPSRWTACNVQATDTRVIRKLGIESSSDS